MKASHGGKPESSEIQESFANGRISALICNVTNKAAANFSIFVTGKKKISTPKKLKK